jgi:hypothetical protein
MMKPKHKKTVKEKKNCTTENNNKHNNYIFFFYYFYPFFCFWLGLRSNFELLSRKKRHGEC